MNTHAWRHEQRKQFTPTERAKIFADAGECCAKCTRKLTSADDWDIDHRIALENGGTNDPRNLQVLCGWCHEPKTSDDHRAASKSKRIYTRRVVPGRFMRSRSWRR